MPTSQDFVKTIDLTGLLDVSGSQMNQLIDTAQPASDKGLRIVTTDTALNTPDVPNPNVTLGGIIPSQWKRYKWVRLPYDSTGTIKEYNWNEHLTSDVTYLKWEQFADLEGMQAEIDQANTNATNAVNTANNANTNATNALANVTSLVEDVAIAQQTADIADGKADINTAAIATLQTTVTGVQSNLTSIGHDLNLLAGALNRVALVEFYISETRTSGTNAADCVGSVWTRREVNTVVNTSAQYASKLTLNGDNTITLQPGLWTFDVNCPAQGGVTGQYHKARLAKSDGSFVYGYGSSEYSDTTVAMTKSRILAVISTNAPITIAFDHITAQSIVAGFGTATNFGSEIYLSGVIKYHGLVV